MYELALQYGLGPISLRSIAANQGISEHYLEQLISALRNAGFVTSMRGAQGGYILAKDPAEITVGDIIKVMEGPIALVDCLLAEAQKNPYCEKADVCVTRDVWAKVCASINEVLDSITLADLCKKETGVK